MTDLAHRTSDDICKDINACTAKLAAAEKKVEDCEIPVGSTSRSLKTTSMTSG